MESLNKLPRELFEDVLRACIFSLPKTQVANLRLVSKEWNTFLRPYVCTTLNLDFSRLSRSSDHLLPDMYALDSLAPVCKNISVDLRAVRDDVEIDVLSAITTQFPPEQDTTCAELADKYRMTWKTFTEIDYIETIEDMLSRLINVEGLAVRLPLQLVGRGSASGKLILANTLKAFATRPEEISAGLKTLVLDKVTDQAMYDLVTNPIDLSYLFAIVSDLQHLVLTLTRDEVNLRVHTAIGSALCQLITEATQLESLALLGLDRGDESKSVLQVIPSEESDYSTFLTTALPLHGLERLCSVTRLELKSITLHNKTIISIAKTMPLEEIYLSDITLQSYQTKEVNEDSQDTLWIGLPNQRQREHGLWVAPYLRAKLLKLRVCRASLLRYVTFAPVDDAVSDDFDIRDPSGRARTLAQRFVEVVMGHQQPPAPDGHPIEYFGPEEHSQDEMPADKAPMGRGSITDYDTLAYQTSIGNSTSSWLSSLDGYFMNRSISSMKDLEYIAKAAHEGITKLQQNSRSGNASNPLTGMVSYFVRLWNNGALQ